jgi:hypothetical protein
LPVGVGREPNLSVKAALGVHLGGTFTAPNPLDSHTVVVAWGDGSANTTLSLGSGVYSFSGVSHTYPDNLPNNAPYTITVTVTDNY